VKRAGALAAVLVVLALAVGGCGGHSSTPTSALDKFKKILGHAPTGVARQVALKNELVVADDGNYPPQSWIDKSGKLQGSTWTSPTRWASCWA